ncbi:MAG: 50S ribosomal protein L25 [Chloroflexi bacterium]|nr:50S ribosomal protein L25 [Chloroflexota bacterium]
MVQKTKVELKVSPREVLGKQVKAMRREGVIPANVYGHALESVAIQISKDDLVHLLHSAGRNEIVYLRLDGEEARPTFLRQIQRNPVTDAILHVDFYQISLKEKVRMEVRLVLVGTAPAEQTQGGTLLHGLDRIAVEGLPTEIPSVIEVDVSGLDVIDATIYVHELSVPEEITVLSDPAQVVAKVAPPQVEKEPEEEVEEEVEGEVPEGEVPEGEEGAPKDEEGAAPAAEDRKEGKR